MKAAMAISLALHGAILASGVALWEARAARDAGGLLWGPVSTGVVEAVGETERAEVSRAVFTAPAPAREERAVPGSLPRLSDAAWPTGPAERLQLAEAGAARDVPEAFASRMAEGFKARRPDLSHLIARADGAGPVLLANVAEGTSDEGGGGGEGTGGTGTEGTGQGAGGGAGGGPGGVGGLGVGGTDLAGGGGEMAIVMPRPEAGNPPAVYPEEARKRGETGTVVVRVEVRADGSVGEVRVQRTCGSELLEAAALKAIRKWRFAPATEGGRAVACQVDVPFEFVLRAG